MKNLWFLLCIGFYLAGIQLAEASNEEPKPVYDNIYASVYEQTVLLKVLQDKETDELQLLLANAGGMDVEKEALFRAGIETFVRKMQKRKEKTTTEKAFLEYLFYSVHRKYLKEYKPYYSFYSLLERGTYNCLSATALYAVLMDKLGISYQIYETDYHIFLLVKTAEGEQVLFESTDPLYGFISDREEIDQRIQEIRDDAQPQAEMQLPDRPYFNFDLQLFRPVSLKQLAGLQYYNQAAYLYNTQRVGQAAKMLSKGRLLYQAERFDEFASLLAELR